MNERKIKDGLLERLLANDLDPAVRAELARTLESSEADRARLAELERDSAAFLALHPPGPLVARFEETTRRRSLFLRLAPFGLAAAATAAILLAVQWSNSLGVDRQGIQLAIYAADDAGERIVSKSVVSSDDAVRFLLESAHVGYVAVLGRDASGEIRVYYPKDGTAAPAYDPKGPMLPGVTELAPNAGREDLLGFFCPIPFDVAPIVEALRAGEPLESVLPAGTLTAKVPLQKH
ncbi:MAG TPA: hypothetical protein DFS52_01145 [Myxococcales bacterium]|nr:hypothetical protein [Myxococcales bacterium]